LQSFAEAVAKAPNDALPALWAGVAAAAVGRWQDARTYLREALRRPHTPDEGRLAEAWLARLEALDAPVSGESNPAAGIAWLARYSNPRLTLTEARWLGDAVDVAARRAGLDSWLLASVIYIESRFNHESVSWAGAVGLGQLMPGTAQAAGVDPRDPWQNVMGSAQILRWHYLEFKDWTLALAAYNAGANAVRRYRGVPPYAETQWYVRAVLWVYGQLRRPG
jgi:soluble lytic murein transglycosylase-like protein